jgi:hypothetical protein
MAGESEPVDCSVVDDGVVISFVVPGDERTIKLRHQEKDPSIHAMGAIGQGIPQPGKYDQDLNSGLKIGSVKARLCRSHRGVVNGVQIFSLTYENGEAGRTNIYPIDLVELDGSLVGKSF